MPELIVPPPRALLPPPEHAYWSLICVDGPAHDFIVAKVIAAYEQHRPKLLIEMPTICRRRAIPGGSPKLPITSRSAWCEDCPQMRKMMDPQPEHWGMPIPLTMALAMYYASRQPGGSSG